MDRLRHLCSDLFAQWHASGTAPLVNDHVKNSSCCRLGGAHSLQNSGRSSKLAKVLSIQSFLEVTSVAWFILHFDFGNVLHRNNIYRHNDNLRREFRIQYSPVHGDYQWLHRSLQAWWACCHAAHVGPSQHKGKWSGLTLCSDPDEGSYTSKLQIPSSSRYFSSIMLVQWLYWPTPCHESHC